MEVMQTQLVARFYKKLSKSISDWSAMLCTTSDISSLPAGINTEKGKAMVTVTGIGLPELEGCNVRFFGKWTNSKYGIQLKADSYEILPPDNEKGLVSFLASDRFQGIGKKTAERIVSMYGMDTIEIIEKSPNKLLAVKGITPAKLGALVASYESVQTFSRLAVFLAPFGISGETVLKIHKKYGRDAILSIQDNPYLLQEISGIGFKTSDKIARGLGVALDSYMRIEGGIKDRLIALCDGTGNMYADVNDVYYATLNLLNEGIDPAPITKEKFQSAINYMIERKKLVVRKERDVYLFEYDQAESSTSRKLLWLLSNPIDETTKKEIDKELDKYSKSSAIALSKKQEEAVRLSLKNRVSVITGGPGTGKSTITKAIIEVYKAVFGENITLMAPTGKASRRMAECTGLNASTIHSRLHIYDGMENKPEQIDEGLIVVDEVSMVDGILLSQLTEAINNKDCHLILIGDIDQLPSVGPGAVLGEIIKSGVIPTTRLVEIFRQKDGGIIVDNAIKINNGRYDLKYDDDFVLIEAKNETEAKKIILDQYKKEVSLRGIDNVALLSPLRKTQSRFTCVSEELNKELQNATNPLINGKAYCKILNKEFRVGDKVMQWKNCETSSNGDVGEVVDIFEGTDGVTVEIVWDNGNRINAKKEDLETIDLAYAMSIHKSQGSEYDCVIIPMISAQFSRLHKRNLFYTGVTRAKKKVIIVGDKQCIYKCIEQSDTNKRKTLLADRLVVNKERMGDSNV